MKESGRSNQRSNKKRGLSFLSILALLGLLFFPSLAAHRFAQVTDPRVVCGYLLWFWLLTFFLYRHDKKRAASGGWRTPEAALHLCEALGGWPAAFLAQRIFRHKNAKTRYQVVFWLIVLAHEFLALDYLRSWRSTREVLRFLHFIA